MSDDRLLDELVNEFISLKTSKRMEEFLRGILTEVELSEISKRLQIVKFLKAGVTQKEIAEKLGVGIATVTRGSKELQRGRFK